MKKILPLLSRNIFLVLILLFSLVLFVTNFRVGTYFVGWDNLLPELNFSVNFERSFYAIWQEYRGLGLLDGMSYAANLPHYLFLYALSFFLPINMLRYVFIFLMHLIGGIGVYLFLQHEIFKDQRQFKDHISFLGAISYLFNLITFQVFYAPYELFTIHFAFLPWLFLFSLSFLRSGSLTRLGLFTLISLLSIPQAHVPTIFIVYVLSLAILFFPFIFQRGINAFKRVSVIFLIIFFCNAFWAFPYFYSALNNSETIINAKINQMSTEDIYLKNQRRGTLSDVLLLNGFMLDMIETRKDGTINFVMDEWRKSRENSVVIFTSLSMTAIFILGFSSVVIKRKSDWTPYVLLAGFSFIFLANDTFILSQSNNLIRARIPLVSEIFRFSFTKFSIIWLFCYTVFFSIGIFKILNYFSKTKSFPLRFPKILVLMMSGLIIFSSLPAFRGNFLYGDLKNKIPLEYFQTIDFLKQQDKNTRVAIFPQPTFWNWQFYRWGSRGSGFLWYGIPQASFSRAFDPWSSSNENYFWETYQATYSDNLELFEKTLQKYQIKWLVIDEYIYLPSSSKSLFVEETKNLFLRSGKIKLEKTYGKISVFQVNLDVPINDYMFLANNLPAVGSFYKWGSLDKGFVDNGNYISSDQGVDIYYPFRSLFTGRKQEELEFTVDESAGEFVFRKTLPLDLNNYTLELPESSDELLKVNPQNLGEMRYLEPKALLEDGQIKVIVPKTGGYLGADIEAVNEPSVLEAKNCDQFNQGKVTNEVIKEEDRSWLRLKSTDATNCSVAFWLPHLPTQYSYLITVESRNIRGKSLLFWLENISSQKADIETYLPSGNKLSKSIFIQPPMTQDGLEYSLHFDNISIGRDEVVNDLGRVTVNMLPYKFLTGIKLVKRGQLLKADYEPVVSTHPNPSLYEIYPQQIEFSKNSTLILSQSFDQGWLAYITDKNTPHFLSPLFGRKIDNHVLVNNWENGWRLDGLTVNKDQKIVLFFWPQLLEYLGFLLLLGLFGCLGLLFLRQRLTYVHQ